MRQRSAVLQHGHGASQLSTRRLWRWLGIVGLTISLIVNGQAVLAEDDDPTATASETPTATPTSTPDKLAAVLGQSAGSDYVAKHFSLIFGAVVLNPFKFTTLPTPTMEMSPVTTPVTTPVQTTPLAMPTPQIKLNVGGTDVKPFLEGGFRYRWAWLDRYPITTAARVEALASASPEKREEIRAARVAIDAARASKADHDGKVSAMTAGIALKETALQAKQAELAAKPKDKTLIQSVQELNAGISADEKLLHSEQEKANDDAKTISANNLIIHGFIDPQVAAARASWRASQGSFAVFDPPSAFKIWTDSTCGWADVCRTGPCPTPNPDEAQVRKPAPDPQCGCPADRFTWLVPDDWTLRMGYVFNADDQLGAATLAGASTFYAELAPGWNLFHFGFPTAFPDDTPIRGAINFEPDLLLASDSSLLAVHTRALFGLSLVFGVPFQQIARKAKPREQADDDPAVVPTPEPIIEFVTRVGGVYVDTPEYADNTTRLVKSHNELPDFSERWGYGMDAEMNIPIVAVPGYVVMRGSLNAGFDPSTWAVQVGYTIPFSSLLTGLGANLNNNQ